MKVGSTGSEWDDEVLDEDQAHAIREMVRAMRSVAFGSGEIVIQNCRIVQISVRRGSASTEARPLSPFLSCRPDHRGQADNPSELTGPPEVPEQGGSMMNLGWFASSLLALLCSGYSAYGDRLPGTCSGRLVRVNNDSSPAGEKPRFITNTLTQLMRACAILCALTALAGCSIQNPTDNPFTVQPNANGKPTVWKCTVVQMASPPRYGCPDNKTYTAFQLYHFRTDTDTSMASK
jgi:hypothetical protein